MQPHSNWLDAPRTRQPSRPCSRNCAHTGPITPLTHTAGRRSRDALSSFSPPLVNGRQVVPVGLSLGDWTAGPGSHFLYITNFTKAPSGLAGPKSLNLNRHKVTSLKKYSLQLQALTPIRKFFPAKNRAKIALRSKKISATRSLTATSRQRNFFLRSPYL